MPSPGYGTVLTTSGRIAGPEQDDRGVVAAFALSRAVVLLAGIAGADLVARVAGWRAVDPGRLSESFGRIGNPLSATAVRWDAVGYLNIAQHGYTQARETILFPLYPLLIAILGRVIFSYVIAGVLISAVSFVVGLVLLARLTELELGRQATYPTVILLMVAPVSFFFTAVYTESLCLALSVGSIYAARHERLRTAALLAALASLTRVTGILLIVPIVMMSRQREGRLDRRLGWLLLAPGALLGFLAYMSSAGYGWLAPLTNQHAHRFGLAGPVSTVLAALESAARGLVSTVSGAKPFAPSLEGPLSPQFDSVLLLVVLVVAVCALVEALRRLPLAYSVYGALALLVCIFSQTKIQPLEGLDRYTLTIFPLWMAAGAWISEHRLLRAVVPICLVALAFYAFEFATWAFIA
ncbi:MAG: mannosyltransferase family protein [Solirubrobacteraceae bacterium]